MKINKGLVLSAALVAALLPVLILRDFTPSNELRYLSIADEAIANGDVFTFTNQGVPYADKPPLYIWIVMLGRLLFGQHTMWFLGLFSLIPALVIVWTMNRWVRSVTSEGERRTASLMLMSSGLFLGLAVVLRMDMLMNMFITLALYTFYRIYDGSGDTRRNRILFPVYVFLALFSKGPVGILVPLVATVAFLAVSRKLRSIGRYWGWLTWGILLAGCAVWFGGVYIEVGREYLDNLLFHQTIDRAVDAFHHKEPFYYYLISVWYSIAPWSLLAIAAIVGGCTARKLNTDLERFFLTIIITTFVMLSAFSSKIAVYLAPTFPFFIYLGMLMYLKLGRRWWLTLTVALPTAIWIIVLPGLFIAAKTAPEMGYLLNGWCVAAGAILCIAGIATAVLLIRRRDTLNPAIETLAAGLFAAIFVGGFALPAINCEIGYGDLCRKAAEVSAAEGRPNYYVWRVHRPENMDVYLHADVTDVTTEDVLAGKCADGVLILPAGKLAGDDALSDYTSGKPAHTVGRYMVIEP